MAERERQYLNAKLKWRKYTFLSRPHSATHFNRNHSNHIEERTSNSPLAQKRQFVNHGKTDCSLLLRKRTQDAVLNFAPAVVFGDLAFPPIALRGVLLFFWWSQMSRASFNNRLDLITECWLSTLVGTWKALRCALNALLLTGRAPPRPVLPLAPGSKSTMRRDSRKVSQNCTRIMKPTRYLKGEEQ